jgi:hypothetical protein
MPSNQGRELDVLLGDVDPSDMKAAADVGWAETHNHPADASCYCVALEILALLYERGYRLSREQQ